MCRFRLATILITLLAGLALPGGARAAEPLQWHFLRSFAQSHSQPLPGQPYGLVNDTGGKLRHGNRLVGVDLGWRPGVGSLEWTLVRPNGRDHRQVSPTENVALYNVRHRRYLVYGRQRFGINLAFSSSPKYQWRVKQDQIRTPGPTLGRVRDLVYNTAARSYLVYQRQRYGINLGWQRGAPPTAPPPVVG